MSSVNWDEINETAGTEADDAPMPPGTYITKVETAEATTTAKGKVMWKLRLRVLIGSEKNKAAFTQLVVSPESPKALQILSRQLDALGLPLSRRRGMTNEAIAEAMIGQVVQIETDTREWQGEDRTNVKSITKAPDEVKAATGAAPKKAKDDDDEAPPTRRKRRRTPEPEPEPVDDDDDEYEDDDDDAPAAPFGD